MGTLSYFESRPGKLSDTPQDVYNFVTNLRNFEQFVPRDSVRNWVAEKDFCSFDVPMIGTVTLRIAQKQEFSKVVYNGDALKKNDFSIVLNIAESNPLKADVNVQLNADLDPMMKMVASKPIRQFLDTLIDRMESFHGWKDRE